MIRNLKIRNFQVWKNLDIDLAPFTAIVGPSGFGKSSIVRALIAAFSASAGTDDTTHGQSYFGIEMDVDGRIIKRVKSSAENSYTLDGNTYTKVGREVPTEIREVLNLATLDIGGKQVSPYLSEQFDPPFLIFDSPGMVAQILMAVLGVEQLTDAIKRAKSDQLSVSRERKATEARIQSIESDPNMRRHASGVKRFMRNEPLIRAFQASIQIREQAKRVSDLADSVSDPLEVPDLTNLRALLAKRAIVPEVPEIRAELTPPDTTLLRDLLAKYEMVEMRMRDVLTQRRILAEKIHEQEVDNAEYISIMGESCPLCGAPIKEGKYQ